MNNLILLALAASPAAGGLNVNHASTIVGVDYCTWGPNFACYATGWPSCCSEDDATALCPVDLPPCEIIELVADSELYAGPPYCKSPQDFTCYTDGLPACCMEGYPASASCSSETDTSPACDAVITSTSSTNIVSTTPESGAEGFSSSPMESKETTTTSSTMENASGGSSTVAAADSVTTIPLIGSSWVATEFFDGNSMVQVIPGSTITFSVEDGKLSGNAGCNSYFVSVESMTTSSFQTGPDGGMTEMGCEDQDLMSQEDLYFQNFRGDTIEYNILDGGSLELLDGESNIIAHYVPQTISSGSIVVGTSTTVSTSSPESASTTVSTSSPELLMENASPVFVVSTLSMATTSISVCLVIW